MVKPEPRHGDGLAVASLVCGLACFVPVVTQLLAVVFGLAALLRPRRRQRRPALAIAGLILGMLVGFGWVMLLTVSSVATVTGGGVVTGYGGAADSPADEAALNDHLQSALRHLGHALAAYRRDLDRWPPHLDALVPTYLSATHLEELDPDRAPTGRRLVTLVADVRFREDPPTAIVAYTVPVTCDEFGEPLSAPHRWVLRLNGEVLRMASNRVDTELAERGRPPRRPQPGGQPPD